MKKTYFAPALLAITTLIGACSSLPTTTSLLDQTRSDYMAAQNNPNVARYAPLEMARATDALGQANAAASHDDSAEKIDRLAYLARQQVALTQEVAKQKAAEASVADAAKARDRMRLAQRTNEADQARSAAEAAQGEAAAARDQTRQAMSETAEAARAAQQAQAQAAELAAQLADLAAKQTERGMVITLGDVLFGTDLARLNAGGMRTAQKLADVLRQNPQRTVLIEGFADSTGATGHNQQLSERRANAVSNALQQLGVAAERIAVHGYGETYPVAANDTAEHRQLNRRVEIILSDAGGKVAPR